jgi:hypothetical protein
MGEDVESRRDFIEEDALDVKNLDVQGAPCLDGRKFPRPNRSTS